MNQQEATELNRLFVLENKIRQKGVVTSEEFQSSVLFNMNSKHFQRKFRKCVKSFHAVGLNPEEVSVDLNWRHSVKRKIINYTLEAELRLDLDNRVTFDYTYRPGSKGWLYTTIYQGVGKHGSNSGTYEGTVEECLIRFLEDWPQKIHYYFPQTELRLSA